MANAIKPVQTTSGEKELIKIEKFKTDFFREMKEVWEERRGYDVTLVIGDEKFQCHRIILSIASGYFKKLFYGDFKEKNTDEVTIQDIDSKSFETILVAIYSGEIDLHAGNLYQILKTSSFFNITAIEEACHSYIISGNHVHHLIEICLFADLVGKRELFTECVKHIGTDLVHFSKVEVFRNLPFDIFNLVLQQASNSDNVENILLLAIIQWTKFNQVETKMIKILLGAAKLTMISPAIMANMISAIDRNFCVDGQTRKNLKLGNVQCTNDAAPTLNVFASAINPNTGAKGVAVFKLVDGEINWILDSFVPLFSYGSIFKVVTVGNTHYILTNEEKANKIYQMDSYGKLKVLESPPYRLNNFQAVVDGVSIYVIGIELLSNTANIKGVLVYNTISDTWNSISLPVRHLTKRFAVAVLDSKIYIIVKSQIYYYDCTTSSFSTLTEIPYVYSRYTYAAACANNEKVYFCSFRVEDKKISNEFIEFDLKTSKLNSLKPMNNNKSSSYRLVHYDGFLYAIDHQPFEDLERYNIELNNWFSVPPLPSQSSYRDQVVSTGQILCAEVSVYRSGFTIL